MTKNYIPTIKKILPRPVFEFLVKNYYRFTDKTIHTDFNVRSIYRGHQNVTYRGVQAIRCPFDYVLYQMIISEIRPDLIIEIGTHKGGGSLYLADLLDTIGSGMIHTLDITEAYDKSLLKNPRIKVFSDGWEKYDLREADGFSKILIIEDGAHTYEHSIGALKKFAPLVSPGSYLIVEDGILDELGMKEKYSGGPVRAIHEFLKDNPNFEIDRKWCDFFGKNATFNIDGYLKRIK
jgi:cephalosporin hydroxylase